MIFRIKNCWFDAGRFEESPEETMSSVETIAVFPATGPWALTDWHAEKRK
jgi:hypothetical protein